MAAPPEEKNARPRVTIPPYLQEEREEGNLGRLHKSGREFHSAGEPIQSGAGDQTADETPSAEPGLVKINKTASGNNDPEAVY